jgi:hypothetical protein
MRREQAAACRRHLGSDDRQKPYRGHAVQAVLVAVNMK